MCAFRPDYQAEFIFIEIFIILTTIDANIYEEMSCLNFRQITAFAGYVALCMPHWGIDDDDNE